ncbi:MAG: 6-phosphofructokinase [Cytophagales bacterium]|nr:6-phosphofructokinase [Cytophagales bacterium]
MKSIAVFTSGGDSPGMNACIRAVVRAGIYKGLTVVGIRGGYEGMIEGDFMEMQSASVSNIVQRGGTILKSSRSSRFMTNDGMKLAYEQLKKNNIDGVVAIGGDGTFKGAGEFYTFQQSLLSAPSQSGKGTLLERIPFVGIPGTIDNDLYGTDYTIGYDTAVNTALEAIDKIRDTADSHHRLFFIEVMGKDAGFIALRSGIAGGAEAILIPETKTDISQLIKTLKEGWQRHKYSMIVVVAEGDEQGGAFEIAKKVKEKFTHYDTRVTVLGHLQRGGRPTCLDRVLASRLGVAAVEALLKGEKNIMVGIQHWNITYTSFDKATKHHKDINRELFNMVKILAS